MESNSRNNKNYGISGTNKQTQKDINIAARNKNKTGTTATTSTTLRSNGDARTRPATTTPRALNPQRTRRGIDISMENTATETDMDISTVTNNKNKTTRSISEVGTTATEIIMNTKILKVGPEGADIHNEPEAPTQKLYKYNVQLSFRQPLVAGGTNAKKGNYNVPYCFKQVVKQLNIFSPAITLLPYNTSGINITNADQLPDDEIEDYITYYHNHMVTANGQLTGMCSIEAPFPWYQIKDEKKTLFKWLRDKGVYMKYVSFKADQVSAAGWFYGLPPDILKRDDAIKELRQHLGEKLPADLDMQLSARTMSITEKVSRNRFTFKGVAVECDRSRARELQEVFYSMESPKEAKFKYSITGGALFVPFVEDEVWPNSKILGMAKAHVQEMDKLGQVFLQNVRDIDQVLIWRDGDEESLREMLTNCTSRDGNHMIHSVHKTNREGMITLLYYKEFEDEVHQSFKDIQAILEKQLSEESKTQIAIEGKHIVMAGRRNQIDSSNASREYSSYADIILAGLNPQGGDEEEEEVNIQSPPRKKQTQRRTPPRMTYSQITKTRQTKEITSKRKTRPAENEAPIPGEESASDDSQSESTTKNSDLMDRVQDKLDKMQANFESRFGKVEGMDINTTQKLIEENNDIIRKSSEEYFNKKFAELSEELSTKITRDIERSVDHIFSKFATMHDQQNTMIYNLQEGMKTELLKIYNNMEKMQEGKPIDHPATNTFGQVARSGNFTPASDGGT
jgi:hypothetical protein